VAQDPGEQLAGRGGGCLLAGRLDEPDPVAHRRRLGVQALLGLRQHRRRRVEERDPVAQAGQRQGLVRSATAHVEHRGRRLRQVGEELLVQDERPDPALDGRVRAVDELVCQR
jgi:hypothetical protein